MNLVNKILLLSLIGLAIYYFSNNKNNENHSPHDYDNYKGIDINNMDRNVFQFYHFINGLSNPTNVGTILSDKKPATNEMKNQINFYINKLLNARGFKIKSLTLSNMLYTQTSNGLLFDPFIGTAIIYYRRKQLGNIKLAFNIFIRGNNVIINNITIVAFRKDYKNPDDIDELIPDEIELSDGYETDSEDYATTE